MTEILLRPDIMTLRPDDLNERGVGLLGVGIENVLTDYGGTAIRRETVQKLFALMGDCPGLRVALIDAGGPRDLAVQEAANAFSGYVPVYHGVSWRREFPVLFSQALDEAQTEAGQAAVVHHRLGSWRNLRAAGCGLFVWTEPYGDYRAPADNLTRPLTKLVRSGLGAYRWSFGDGGGRKKGPSR